MTNSVPIERNLRGAAFTRGRRFTARKCAYWISTGLLCFVYTMSAIWYLADGQTARRAFHALGYPAYIVPILIVAKLLGVMAILSRASIALSDLAYAGIVFHLMLALLSQVIAGSGYDYVLAIVFMVAVAVSFLTQNSARGTKSPYSPSPAG